MYTLPLAMSTANHHDDADSIGSIQFPSFAKCCSSANYVERYQNEDLIMRPNSPYDETMEELPRPPPVMTVQTGCIDDVLSTLTHTDANGFPLTPTTLFEPKNDGGDSSSTIDFAAEFRQEEEAPTAKKNYPPPQASASGRRLHSSKRLTPSPAFRVRSGEDSTFDNLEELSTLGKDFVTAIKQHPSAKVGLVFTRSKSSSATTIISHVLQDSIFSSKETSLKGATVHAVNGIPIRNPYHAAELVSRAERNVRLTVAKQPPKAKNSHKKEIDIQLLRCEQKMLKGQLARMKRQQERSGSDPGMEEYDTSGSSVDKSVNQEKEQDCSAAANDAHSTADEWSEANIVQNAFPKNAFNQATSTSKQRSGVKMDANNLTLVMQEESVNFSAPVTDNDDSSEADTLPSKAGSTIPLLRGEPPTKTTKSKRMNKELPTPTSNTSNKQAITQLSPIRESKNTKAYARVAEEEEEAQPNNSATKSSNKLTQVANDERRNEDDEEEEEARKSKTKSRMSFKRRAFGLKSRNSRKDAGRNQVMGSSSSEEIGPTVSTEEIMNDLNSLHSSSNVDSREEEGQTQASDVMVDTAVSEYSEGGKQQPNDGQQEGAPPAVVRSEKKPASPLEEKEPSSKLTALSKEWSEGGKKPYMDQREDASPTMMPEHPQSPLEEEEPNSKLSDLSIPVERATSFIVESIVSSLSHGGFESMAARSFTEEAVFLFPIDDDDDEYDNDEFGLKTASDEDNASEDNDANRPVEAVLTAKKTPQQAKKKSFLKRALFKKTKKQSSLKQQQDMGRVVADQDESIVSDEYTIVKDQDNVGREEEAIASKADTSVVEDQGEAGGIVEDQDDNASNIDLNVTQESFFKRALFKKKRSLVKKKQQELQKVTAPWVDCVVEVFDVDKIVKDQDNFRWEEEASVPEDADTDQEKQDNKYVVKDQEDDDNYSFFALDITPTGDVEVHTPSKRELFESAMSPISAMSPSNNKFFDCALSPISAMSPSDNKRLLRSGGVDFTRTRSNNDATASCSLTDESNSLAFDSTAIITPPSRLSGHHHLPQAPPTPTKIYGESWDNMSLLLFGQGGPPSPSASIIGSTPAARSVDGEKSPTIAVVPRKESCECRLEDRNTSIGKESVSISMELEAAGGHSGANNNSSVESNHDSLHHRQLQLQGPPPVNRKLNINTDDFNDSLYKAQIQSRDSVDVTTVYEEGSFSFEENPLEDEIQLARAKQHAFDIVKRSKNGSSIRNGSSKLKLSNRVGSLKKNLFPKNNESKRGQYPIDGVMHEDINDITLATADMTNEASMLLL